MELWISRRENPPQDGELPPAHVLQPAAVANWFLMDV